MVKVVKNDITFESCVSFLNSDRSPLMISVTDMLLVLMVLSLNIFQMLIVKVSVLLSLQGSLGIFSKQTFVCHPKWKHFP